MTTMYTNVTKFATAYIDTYIGNHATIIISCFFFFTSALPTKKMFRIIQLLTSALVTDLGCYCTCLY